MSEQHPGSVSILADDRQTSVSADKGAARSSSDVSAPSAARVYSSEEERQIIVLGSKAAGWRDRIDWRKAREGRDLGDCNLDCDACYRSRLFSLGLEVLRVAEVDA